MPFNSAKNGFRNEVEFIRKINNKKYNELDYKFQLFIKDLYYDVNNNSKIVCYKNEELQKCDIFIKVDGIVKRISIKKGVKNSVHTEPISEFVHFLIENKMPRELVYSFLKYHYADGTTDGTGINRMKIEDYKKLHQQEIEKINEFINQEKLIIKAIDRFVVKGRNSSESIDAIIYGVPEDFIWIKKDDIYKILLSKRNMYCTSIHFSSLTYQPLSRCINKNPKYEKDRFISQIKWYNLCDDIIQQMNNNVMNKHDLK